jgi:broad specificity phosphatase PhoE
MQKHCRIISLRDFNEIDSGICDRMTYEEIRLEYPKIAAPRKRRKYYYEYPEGEGYVSMEKRIWRGIKEVIYLAGVVCNGMHVGKWLIENSRFHGENIFDHIEMTEKKDA